RARPDATIALINPAAAQMLGHTYPDDLIGEKMHERPEFETHDTDEFTKLMLEHGKVQDYESTLIRKDGEEINVLMDGRPEFNEHGELLYFEGNIIDITEKKKIEQQLLQAQKLESVGRLAGGVAHDFNNILTSLSMNAEMGTMQTDATSEAHERFAEMEELITKASRITRQLLQFSRKEKMKKKNVSVNELLREILKLLRKIIGEDINIHFEPGTDLPPVYADGSQIEQVIMNLCINARDAMDEGGTLILRTGLESDRPIPDSQDGSTQQAYVCIDILDTGKGIPAEIQDKIFDPFFTTKGPGDGTGLGLSIVHGIVQQHDGWIDMESHEDKGTLFSIFLPASEKKDKDEVQAPAMDITGGDESILLAEDDDNIRESIKAVLSKFGYTVLTASNGKDALETLELNGTAIDMVITDVVMPMMGGNTLFYEARKKFPELPFLFLSGYPESVITKKLSKSMLAHFQQKPIQIPDLLREVRNTLKNK
ncbi:MAG: response regulator, partial [Candidatus Marinimicrobia bacterium]|nr:response regulator [Candidatus Neomarinimicrobiota bacterium]